VRGSAPVRDAESHPVAQCQDSELVTPGVQKVGFLSVSVFIGFCNESKLANANRISTRCNMQEGLNTAAVSQATDCTN